jgi:hypothetical protein
VASLALLQGLGWRPKGEEWGASFPFLLKHLPQGFPLGLAGWAIWGMVCLAQVARTLSLRPTQASIKWDHFGPTLEPSRTLWYNTDKL